MFLGNFQPFPAECGTLTLNQNRLCDALFEFISNDYEIYQHCKRWIEESLIKKIKYDTFDDIKACKAYENLLISYKKYIVEEFNKPVFNNNNYGRITTRTLNKDVRRHLTCLLVNDFLGSNQNEIQQITNYA
jgi:phenolic acid decarboxylase